MSFSIEWQWQSALHEPPEVAGTGAQLKIALGQKVLTRNVDDGSRTVSDEVRLSAYPLALWLASNWWRLRWESLPSNGKPCQSWRMSHELAAAGYGYLWPQILMASDGESIQLWAAATPEGQPASVKYLTSTYGVIAAEAFEHELDHFFDGVVARLDALKIGDTPLHQLLAELTEERADGGLAAYRRLEASAGFDAGEGPADILDRLMALIPQAGPGAAQEIATLCASSPESGHTLDQALHMAAATEVRASPASIPGQAQQADSIRSAPAWVRGRELAADLRQRLGLDGHPVADARLYEVMGILPNDIAQAGRYSDAPLGLAVRESNGQLALHLRRHRPESVRFELARFLCDQELASPDDRWLPATDAKTSRQKVQRAFAAEFLCPIDGLTRHLGGDFSDDALDDAAHHFQVSPLAIQTQLVNNDIVPRELLLDSRSETAFPYALADSRC